MTFVLFILRLWLMSLRVRWVRPLPPVAVYCLWHQDLPVCMSAFRRRNIVVMISRSRDGEWAARLSRALGYGVVRGSTSRGVESMRHLLRALQQGSSVGMALDGPRGPAKVEQEGAQWLVSRSGIPRVNLRVSAHGFHLHSWDGMLIPWPFSCVTVDWDDETVGDCSKGL